MAQVAMTPTHLADVLPGELLLATKLYAPPACPPGRLVSRPRLLEQLDQGLAGRLILVSAPAGFGKTTVLSEWIATRELRVAWVSLDKGDNDPVRFVRYVIAALQTVAPQVGKMAQDWLRAPQPPALEAVLTPLINDLCPLSEELVLVLDDYHTLDDSAVHQAVAFLLDRLPPSLHMVIATRADPPLPLSRWRSRGQMTEIRADDLRFALEEVTDFLGRVMGLDLLPDEISTLEERTEGWIVGLQMAALSMRGRRDVSQFVQSFTGSHRYVLDYLVEEILGHQPQDVQAFLLRTCILKRLTGPLCDAVLEQMGSQVILEQLEKANLFLVPLDDERRWYRYHHLFAELLRAQLQRSLDTQGIAQLHVRASEWHGQNGSVLEAIEHASMASDEGRVERFIEQNYMELVSRGEQSGIRSWISNLDRQLVYRRPWLCIYEAYSHSWFGELDEADRLLEEAEKHIRSDTSGPDTHSILGLLAYVKSRVTAMRGEIDRAIEFCLAAREQVHASNLALQLDTCITLGYEYFLKGDYANAHPILSETVRSGIATGAVINTVAASCLMARLYAVQGLLHRSYDTYQMAAQQIPKVSGQHLGARALVEIGLADLLYEWNDLDAALARMRQGLALLPWWNKADDLVLAYITLARIHLAQANRSEAIEDTSSAAQLTQTRGLFSEARNASEIAQVRLWLAQSDYEAATRWAASLAARFGADHRFGFENELTHIAQARVFIAQKKLDQAISLLSHLEETARSAGRMGRVIEILLLEALAIRDTGDSEHAIQALTRCLALAEPEGYVRLFLDEGQPMQMLLTQWLAQPSSSPLRDYAIHLLSHFGAEPLVAMAPQKMGSRAGDPWASLEQVLVEPLSERELQVLRLVADGLSNQEIADTLILAIGTVKAHVHTIYGKLGVQSRTQAIAFAREVRLL